MRKTTINIIALLLIVLFTHAALIKLLDYSTFRHQLMEYPLLSPFAGFIAWALPAVELITAVLLIRARTYFAGFTLSLILMTGLSSYIIFLLNSHYDVPCACQGLLGFTSWPAQLKFNMIFTLVALAGFLLQLLVREEAKVMRFTPAQERI
ncbi:hypothetical protein F0L74_22085 [Chitinophaga agrisoli]|uniref:Methylamine utilisation protein MauE domain-containing protein n=1 Tax=Chitinophaga agrisoli TaxID=2607653 RepID=A0A5B2VKX5_9BACT|nr:MauE/DoxX family redox-associated membrane protein [Chitinophaga agrisoli]KAA2238907.1 hypothetical protein F0L74_22085 [Chitinophaga agrisoli]